LTAWIQVWVKKRGGQHLARRPPFPVACSLIAGLDRLAWPLHRLV
jgi:hypothetical protein